MKNGYRAWVSLWSRGQSPPWTSWMFHFGGFTDSPHPHNLDTIQATSFFPWWLLLFFQENFAAKRDLKKILRNHRPALITNSQENTNDNVTFSSNVSLPTLSYKGVQNKPLQNSRSLHPTASLDFIHNVQWQKQIDTNCIQDKTINCGI